MPDQTSDPLRIIAGLRAHGVRYVLIGGLAAAAHGSPARTDDVDICPAGDDENLERLGLALQDLGTGVGSGSSGEQDRVSFETVAGRLDCVEMPAGTLGFADLDTRASDLAVGRGIVARVASVDDLAQMKRASGDLAGATQLAWLEDGTPLHEEIFDEPADPKAGNGRNSRRERIWQALENVDRFLTDLDTHGIRRQREEP